MRHRYSRCCHFGVEAGEGMGDESWYCISCGKPCKTYTLTDPADPQLLVAATQGPILAAVKRLWRWVCLPFRLLRQRCCRHVLGSDRGLLIGSNRVDRWCKKCGKHIEIPVSEEDYEGR